MSQLGDINQEEDHRTKELGLTVGEIGLLRHFGFQKELKSKVNTIELNKILQEIGNRSKSSFLNGEGLGTIETTFLEKIFKTHLYINEFPKIKKGI